MANTVINTPELLNLDSTTGATVLAKGATSTRPTSPALSLDYLVVAGGGGTSNDSPGGGGAGGLRTSYGSNSGGGNSNEPNLALNSGVAYTITVGGGGAANTAGSSSVFDSITSAGGGRGSGGGTSYTAGAGGSGGGGAGGSYNNAGGSGTSNQGFAGGTSGGSGSGATYPGGGGGGASAAGVSTVNGGAGGNGGAGLAVNILNATNAAAASVGEVDSSNVYYAGGGGGTSSSPQGTGGTGGGGDGGGTNNGAANTGGGGGGTNATGGSGVVILRYPTADVSSFTVTGTLNTPSAGAQTQFTEGSDTIIVFKQGTGTITFSIPQEESDAVDGTLRFNTDTNKTEYFDSANWYEIVDEYANGYDGIPTNYFDTKLYTGNNATQSIGGYINGSASFNGSSSKIDLPNNILPNNSTASSSCSFWFKSSSGNSTGDSETIIDAWSYSTSEPGWGLFMEPAYGGFPDGQLYLANYYLGGTSGGTGNVTFRDGNWHFGVVVLDFTGGTIKVYIDGNSTPVLSQTVSSANVDVFTTNAAIGYQNANPSYPRHFNGAIDQVRIYSDALTTSEIAYLYANENSTTAGQLNPSGFPTNCVAAYTMDTSANGILNTQDLSTVDYPAGTGCIALYEMNGNSNDTSGAYNGTPVSLSYQGGAFDQAASFDGSNSKITLSSTISGIKTYSFWINPNSSGNATYARRLFGDVGGTSYTNSITFDKPNSKVTYFEGTSARSSDTISNDTWSHIAFTSDGTTLKVYTNGSLSNTYTTSAFVSSIDEICSTASNRQFNGLIDQVRIFDTALSALDITTLARGVATSYSGTTTNVNFNGHLDFAPDFVWIKVRSAAGYNHNLFDTIRGATYRIMSNLSNAQDSNGKLIAFNNNGFSLGAGGDANPSQEMVSWNWKAGGTAVTNNDGTIPTQVSANKDSGFSIATYTGSGVAATVGHGLTQAPDIAIIKRLDYTAHWIVGTGVLSSNNWAGSMYLSTTGAYYTAINYFWDGAATSDVVKIKTDAYVNALNATYVMYSWHSVAGYSKINSYAGTGSAGNSIVTGFQPSFLMVKRTDSTSNWRLYNSAMGTGVELYANTDAAEAAATGYLNFNSTGFEINTTGGWLNGAGGTYLYMAIA